MARNKSETPGLGCLLDAWVPPSNAGDPVGCLATSFTFDSVFFEEECLGRFAGIRASSSLGERSLDWIIDREERLSQIKAVALIDKIHCRGPRSPRWDLLCARGKPTSGILHAKLSLLIWARHLRLVIASANLTPQGYRRNREFFITLEGVQGSALDNQAWANALDYLQLLLPLGGSADHPAIQRAKSIIADARSRVKALAITATQPKHSIWFHGLGPNRPNLFDQLSNHWLESRSVARDVYAVSPFFDPNERPALKTAKALWGLVAERGDVRLHLSAPMIREDQTKVRIQAPAVWGQAPRNSAAVEIFGVEEIDMLENERRPLHAKMIGLENEIWSLMAVGSSNLTQAGTGLSTAPNWEAMVSVLIRADSDPAAQRILKAAHEKVRGHEVENPIFQGTALDQDEDVEETMTILPEAFQRALYRRTGKSAEIEITLEAGATHGWELRDPSGERLAGETEWHQAGSPKHWVLPWPAVTVPSGLEVCWPGLLPAWLPVCAFHGSHLPPPDELRDLPLELLIQVLTTARPLAPTVASYLRRKGKKKDATIENDPHKRVDVSGYLIPRTRRISLVLSALRERLSQPAATQEALNWRLEGPFGALAVVEAIEREAGGVDEKLFFIAELCLELAQARPIDSEGCVPARQQRVAIQQFIRARANVAKAWLSEVDASLSAYASSALAEATRV